jgi:sigma-B regulation protein RsbU (phosphoserine phosphatase)
MDYRTLLRKLEKTLEKIEASTVTALMLQAILETIVKEYGEELGIIGGRIYEQTNNHYQLVTQTGISSSPPSFSISMDFPHIQQVRRDGQIFIRGENCNFEADTVTPEKIPCFAAISLGDNDDHLISFTLKEPIDEPHIEYSLMLIRHVANLKIRHTRLESYISEARKIQMGLLPQDFPKFYDYNIYGRSQPAELVGGDVFVVVPISDSILGLAIADASGHGLPAALQVRDVVIAMRMGIEKDLKIVRTMQKLNSVLSHIGKSHEFITLFYAELEDNGNIFYCNAGHNPPLFFANNEIHELSRGGLILGIYPNAKYERGFAYFDPGNVLVMYTDGVIEATNSVGEEFGTERIINIVEQNRKESSEAICEKIFESLKQFTGAAPAKDDRTIFIVKRD